MLLATAAIAVSQKVKDERAKKKKSRQGLLQVGDSDLARKAFASQTTKRIQNGDAGVQRTGTDTRYEDADSMEASSPAGDSSLRGLMSPTASGVPDARAGLAPPSLDTASPVTAAEKSSLAVTSSSSEMGDGFDTRSKISGLPPYSPQQDDAYERTSIYSRDSDGATLAASDSVSVRADTLQGIHSIKVKTKGSDLSSGFPYHPSLFDLKVHPERWDAFTHQLVETTKFGFGDHAQMWATATAVAMTGAFVTSVFVGRGMKRRIQEEKVKAGRDDMSDGGLGDILKHWNETYFHDRGLFAHLELSESAMKRPDQKSRLFRKGNHWYSGEEKQRKRDERKFMIVVTKLDEDGKPAQAVHELFEGEVAAVIAELPSEEDAKYNVAELPAEMPVKGRSMPIELPGDFPLPGAVSLGYGNSSHASVQSPAGYAELDSDTTELLRNAKLDDERDEQKTEEVKLWPLMASANSTER